MLLLVFFAFALGGIVGSFLNVVIHRIPLEESIVFPASRCPACRTPIKTYDNIPILSYLILRGRCRACREPYSARYPLVELANALFYVAIVQRTELSLLFLPLAAVVSMTIVLIFIDLDIGILPDVLTYPGIVIGIGTALFHLGTNPGDLYLATDWRDSLIGAALGAFIIFGVSQAYKVLRKVEGMGMGDVKMLAMIGAILGWAPVVPVLFLASVTGAIAGVTLALSNRREGLQFAIPFGVFLGPAFLIVLFFGTTLFEWYRSLLVP